MMLYIQESERKIQTKDRNTLIKPYVLACFIEIFISWKNFTGQKQVVPDVRMNITLISIMKRT